MPCPANWRHAITCETKKPSPSNAVNNTYLAYASCKDRFSLRLEISRVTLLSRINAVLARSTRGIASGTQSRDVADLTMYALLSDVNIITIDANATHIPMR